MKEARQHLNQLAPHARDRDTAKHLRSTLDEIDRLRLLAKAVLDTRNAEAKAAMTAKNARANFCRGSARADEGAYTKAMVAASEAEHALREALPPNA